MNTGITFTEFIIRLSFMAGIVMFVICCLVMSGPPALTFRPADK